MRANCIAVIVGLCCLGVSPSAQSLTPKGGNTNHPTESAKHTAADPAKPSMIFQVLQSTNNSEPPRSATQSNLRQFLNKLETDPVVWLTLVIAFFAGWQVLIYRTMRDHTKVIERGYIAISSTDEGLLDLAPGQTPNVQMKVRNHGRTPAVVSAINATLLILIDPLPLEPQYNESWTTKAAAHVMPNEFFASWHIFPRMFPEAGNVIDNSSAWTDAPGIWVIGYVDYRDQFGGRRRNGMAMKYTKALNGTPGGNLICVSQPGYNYDRPRVKGEGSDWDE